MQSSVPGGAQVVATDVSKDMIRLARSRGSKELVDDRVTWLELGVVELNDRLPDGSFDVVTATFFFSELSKEERMDALEVAWSKLKNGGTLITFDEAPSSGRFARDLSRRSEFSSYPSHG